MGIYDRDYERNRYDDEGARLGADWSMTTWIVVVTVGVFALQVFVKPMTDWLELRADWYLRPWEFYRFVTYGFAHDTINMWHIIGNMLMVFIFGRAVEGRYGSREMLALYLTAVVCSGVAWNVAELSAGGPAAASVIGASGAAAAILVLFALNFPRQEILVWGVLPVPAWAFATILVLSDVYGTVTRSGNVAYVAHLGGALFGYLYYRNQWHLADWLPKQLSLVQPKLRPSLRVHRSDEPEDEDDEDKLDAELNRILAKISSQGQDSLTSRERKTLEQASRRAQQRRSR